MNWINVNGHRNFTGDYHELYNISTTPIIYLLDSKKKIIAKEIDIEKLEPFLKNYEKDHPGE